MQKLFGLYSVMIAILVLAGGYFLKPYFMNTLTGETVPVEDFVQLDTQLVPTNSFKVAEKGTVYAKIAFDNNLYKMSNMENLKLECTSNASAKCAKDEYGIDDYKNETFEVNFDTVQKTSSKSELELKLTGFFCSKAEGWCEKKTVKTSVPFEVN